jgi:hypothetical protein
LQSDIGKRRLISPKHLVRVFGATIFLVVILEFTDPRRSEANVVLGMFLIMFGLLNTRHLANIALFIALGRNPHMISGQVTITQGYLLYGSITQAFGILALLVIILLFAPSDFLLGGVIGVIIRIAQDFRWLRRLDKQQATSTPDPNELEKVSGDNG